MTQRKDTKHSNKHIVSDLVAWEQNWRKDRICQLSDGYHFVAWETMLLIELASSFAASTRESYNQIAKLTLAKITSKRCFFFW